MAAPDWGALLMLMCSTLTSSTPFPKDLEPIRVVGWEQSYQYPGFQGLQLDNDTLRLGLDFQTMIRVNHMLYIAARDHVFAVNLTTASQGLVPQLKLTWRSKDVNKCTVRGKKSDECYNYIKVLVPRDDETLFTCGTNAFNPTCRNYKMSSLEQVGEDVIGQARCPFESGQTNVGLFAGGHFYSATMTDFLASDAVIYRSLGDSRPVLRTVKYDSKWLREPRFLHAIDYGNYVYFFLSEIAVEYTSLGKVVFSRVARVCKNDNGGSPRVLERYWTSFLKARLNCSVPGDSFFYFDVLQSLTNVLQINQRPTVVGVFTTQTNSISGSAVCLYYMDDIEKVFNGKFKEQRSSDSSWSPVPEEQVPRPRPGTCAGEELALDYSSSVQYPDETLSFIKAFPLMDQAVPSVHNRPCFSRTSSRSKLTQIVVDVAAGPDQDRTVVFLGSEDGRVLKVLVSTQNRFTAQILEDIDVYNPSKCDVQGQENRMVVGLVLDQEHQALLVAFSSCIIRVPLSRCTQYSTCRRACLSSRDPYCIWLRTGSCVNMAPGFKGFEQDIEGDHSLYSESCPDVLATARNQDSAGDPAYGVRGPPDEESLPGPSVSYSLLITCVLLAFFLGTFLSGLLVSCYCRRSSAQGAGHLGKDTEVSLPHALSLRSLAKLNGLLEGQPKEEKMSVSTPTMYTSLVPNGLASPQKQALPLGDPDLTQSEGDLSGLPTPDISPELPIKTPQHRPHQREPDRYTQSPPSAAPGIVSGFTAIAGNSLIPHHHGNGLGAGSSSSLHLPEECEPSGAGGAEGGGRRGATHFHRSQQSLPRASGAAGEGGSALEDLLKHIQEVSASGRGGIKVLTTGGHHHHHLHHHQHQNNSHTRSHHFNHGNHAQTHHHDSSGPPLNPASSALLQQQPTAAVTRHHSQRHALIKMGSAGGGALPRHHSFNHQGAVPAHFLVRMNTNSSSNGPASAAAQANADAGSRNTSSKALAASTCLTRQHSYSEGPRGHRAAMVRRTVSLKPQIPPKPLFLLSAATPPCAQTGKHHY